MLRSWLASLWWGSRCFFLNGFSVAIWRADPLAVRLGSGRWLRRVNRRGPARGVRKKARQLSCSRVGERAKLDWLPTNTPGLARQVRRWRRRRRVASKKKTTSVVACATAARCADQSVSSERRVGCGRDGAGRPAGRTGLIAFGCHGHCVMQRESASARARRIELALRLWPRINEFMRVRAACCAGCV